MTSGFREVFGADSGGSGHEDWCENHRGFGLHEGVDGGGFHVVEVLDGRGHGAHFVDVLTATPEEFCSESGLEA